MKTNSMILTLVSARSLCGTAGVAQAEEASAATRGSVTVSGRAAKAVVAGPLAAHAYSQFSGATAFVVAAVTGTNQDCAGARQGATSPAADRGHTFTVSGGQIACVKTTAARGSEVLRLAQAACAAVPDDAGRPLAVPLLVPSLRHCTLSFPSESFFLEESRCSARP